MTVFIPERDEVLDTGEGTPVTLETLELRQCRECDQVTGRGGGAGESETGNS